MFSVWSQMFMRSRPVVPATKLIITASIPGSLQQSIFIPRIEVHSTATLPTQFRDRNAGHASIAPQFCRAPSSHVFGYWRLCVSLSLNNECTEATHHFIQTRNDIQQFFLSKDNVQNLNGTSKALLIEWRTAWPCIYIIKKHFQWRHFCINTLCGFVFTVKQTDRWS